jgi:DNA repair protein RadA/Sms
MKLNVQNDINFGTNILDLEVPKQLRKKVMTGVDYIDCALGGQGFTPSMVTLFTGEPGSGKTTMMLAMANSLSRQGAMVVFNTAEESLYQIKLVVERLKLRTGFAIGQETHVPTLLEKCDALRAKNPKKPFFLIIDSLQCMDDGFYKDGHTNSRSSERALVMITDYCKENYVNAIVIGQVSKSGQASGSNKLKHMVDAMMHLGVETKDKDLEGCRVLQTTKNRFGGCGHTFFLALDGKGFTEVARVSNA